MEANSIKNALPAELRDKIDIIHLEETASTNSVAKETPISRDTVYIADRQTGGRGRLGRSFSSMEGGIYMSIAYGASGGVQDSVNITVRCAVAVCRAIERKTGLSLGIKWVNDIHYSGKKLCGILAEGVLLPDGSVDRVVVGIGVNVAKVDFPPEISGIAGAIEEFCDAPDRYELAAEIISEFYTAKEEDIASVLKYYREKMLYIGECVTVHKSGESFSAVPLGVDNDGRLIVKNELGMEMALDSAEVSVRLK